MNILITGGAGFIGSHIARGYLKEGHKVVIVDNLTSGDLKNVPEGSIFHRMDIQDPHISDILQEERIEVINHHAAQISVHASVKDPMFDANTNIIGTLHLLQNAVKYGTRKIIFASTGGAIYGEQDLFPADENHPCRPVSPYAIAKLCVENYLSFFEKQYGLKSVIYRYGNVYGPNQKPQGEAGVVAIYCNRLMAMEPLTIFGSGKQTRDFISVRDIVRANSLALAEDCQGIFNIGTGVETSVLELAEILIKISERNVELRFEPARAYEQQRSSIDPAKFHKQSQWKPELSLEEGLLDTFEYFTSTTI